MFDGDRVCIGILRARGEAMDHPARRLALERALNHADLAPSGLSPQAVLLVRRIRQNLAPDSRCGSSLAGADWSLAVRRRLEDLSRTAARPERGRIAGDPEAVWFRDSAECLACLTHDLADGSVGRRWWWRSWLGRRPHAPETAGLIASALAEQPAELPAVLATLQDWGRVERVLGALGSLQARRLLAILAAAFDLRRIADALAAPEGGGPERPGAAVPAALAEMSGWPGKPAPPVPGGRRPRDPGSAVTEVPSEAAEPPGVQTDFPNSGSARGPSFAEPEPEPAAAGPERRLVETIAVRLPPGLAREARLLLGLALALRHEPWRARSEVFQAEALRFWWATPQAEPRFPPAQPAGPGTAIHRPAFASPSPVATSASEARSEIRSPSGTRTSSELTEQHAASTLEPVAVAESAAQAGEDGATDTEFFPSRPLSSFRSMSASPSEGYPTELGGVFYLINLMLALDLPHCFEADWQLASRVGPWDLLELLARGLLEPVEEEFAADPVWAILAHLAGRGPGQAIGSDLVGSTAFRLPRAWCEGEGEARCSWLWAEDGRTLRVWSEAGWMLAEVPRDGRPASGQVRAEFATAGIGSAAVLLPGAFEAAPIANGEWSGNSGLDRLLALLLPYARGRLDLALGKEPDGASRLPALMRLRADIHLSSSHVDLVASLDGISLPARIAGLDRDPGLLPDFGRVVLFHFR